MTTFIEIQIEPIHITGTGRRYRVHHDGEILLESVRDPEHEAARALREIGADDDDVILTHRLGDPTICMRGRLGHMAGITATEGQTTTIRTVPWSAYTGPAKKEEDEAG